jgi:hypothetical protein
MIYYRVKKEFDQKYINPYIRNNDILIADELITKTELHKLVKRGLIHYKDYEKFFDIVEIPKSKIYFFFGARFEDE